MKIFTKATSFFTILFTMVLALSFASCSGLLAGSDEPVAAARPSPDTKTTLRIRLGSGCTARTALPDSAAEFDSFALEGIPSESGYATVSWNSSAGTGDAKGELTNAEIVVTKGVTYSFTLTAATSGGAVYTDTKELTIQEGANTLSFSLTLVQMGSGGGNAEIAVTLPKDQNGQTDVRKVTVSVYRLNDDGSLQTSPVSTALTEMEVPVTAGVANLDTGFLDPGAYCAVFKLWGGADSSALLGTWREYFGIIGGLTSRGTINSSGTEKSVDSVYTITYHANDTPDEPATITAPRAFSRTSVVTLAAVKALSVRTGRNKIEGWYMDEDRTQAFTTTDGLTHDIDLYARWQIGYTITVTAGIANGTVTPSSTFVTDTEVQAGKTITLTMKPTLNYKLTSLEATKDEDSSAVTLSTENSYNRYTRTFTMPASDVTVTAAFSDTIKMTESVKDAGSGYYYFGDYPQSAKNGAVSVWSDRTKANGELTYIQGTDDHFYVGVSGSYYRVEPVKWKRLTTNYGGKSLLHAAVILTARRFDDDSNNYADSEIRSWLNNGFINTAFTTAARGNIATTTVDNSAPSTNPALHPKQWNSGNNQYACANTSDKIFLLSEKEATTSAYGFADYDVYDSARHRKPTDYAKAKGALVATSGDYAGNGWWWLRSPCYYLSSIARDVNLLGDANNDYHIVHNDSAGIVPALSISF